MEDQHCQGRPTTQARSNFRRDEIAQLIEALEHGQDSQRAFACANDIPRSTLQSWLRRRDTLHASGEAIAFFTSPAGTAFLHRLYLAIHVVMTLLCGAGLRKVSLLLELTGLDAFIAPSYGPTRRYSKALEQAIGDFEQEQRPALVEQMRERLREQGCTTKPIVALEDETFHPACCLVAIDAASNFILLETYSDNRSADAWSSHLDAAIADLPVEVVAVCADEAKGIKAHVERELGAHHCTELFHAQYEITKGCSPALAAKVRHAADAVEKAAQELDKLAQRDKSRKRKGRRRLRLLQAEAEVEHQRALQAHREACAHREQMRDAVRGLSAAYHPYELDSSGQRRSPERVRELLQECIDRARQVAGAAGLSQRAKKCIEKAGRLVDSMVQTVQWFEDWTRRCIYNSELEPGHQRLLDEALLPIAYLELCAQRAGEAEQRALLREVAQEHRDRLEANHAWLDLDEESRESLCVLGRELAQMFVRSDSAVEGRNGQLSLHHHGLHKLQPDRLRALTVIHNYLLRRGDGSSAAQRFFGGDHDDLFADLVKRMPMPSWPAERRSKSPYQRDAA